MANPHGTPIWYELLATDSDKSKTFYESVLGWTVQKPPAGERDYRMLDTGNGMVGGLMQLTADMKQNGAKPTWLFYLGVDDVDATATRVTEAGGTILLKPFDIPNVGRLAMIADPQGIPLYVMRGFSPHDSTAFDRAGMGKCNWHELSTPDQAAAHEFYTKVFGWTYPEKMPMPGGGDYVLAHAGDTRIAGTMQATGSGPTGWQFYFRAPDIDVAAAKVKEGGGQVHAGPMDVPGGDRVIVVSDPEGVRFGITATAKGA